MPDLRAIFDRNRVHWRDHGANVSHNNLVISCPWCNKTSNPDPSEHLAVSQIGEFFCYRNPSHKGRNLNKLFAALGINEKVAGFTGVPVQPSLTTTKDFSEWSYFQRGEDNQEVLDYLNARLFTHPGDVCRKFNLRCAREGRWAGRLLIPLTIGWTGRSMRSHIAPRYLAYTLDGGFFAFSNGSSSVFIVEGAIDAMRIASITPQFDVIAKCTNRLSSALINYLREKKYMTIYNAPDREVPFIEYYKEEKLLRSYCTFAEVKNFKLPEEAKDFGEMTESLTRRVLYG